MEIFYQNVNRIRSKLHEIHINILNSNYDVICLVETNLTDDICNSEIFDHRYHVFRRDRQTTSNKKKDGGGVAIAIKKKYNVIRQQLWETHLEDIWITIRSDSSNHWNLNICVNYLPSYVTIDDLNIFYNNYQNIILEADESDRFVCVGDYNNPDVQWRDVSGLSYLAPSSSTDRKSCLMLETALLCGLYQFNGVPNRNGRFLDLVFCTFEDVNVNECSPLSPLDTHHPALTIEIPRLTNDSRSRVTLKPPKRLNYKKCNYDKVKTELSDIHWSSLLSSPDINKNVDVFYDTLLNIIKKYTPYSHKMKDNYPVWFNYSLKKCIAEKQKYHKLYKKTKNPRDYLFYLLYFIYLLYFNYNGSIHLQ
ncbi:hypothetical protein ABMA27_004435 [Loxostege sticticalis]|uniref:Endonuclease/exonuclease/phosphatase domain-containing protein n=1 Tax=Loxostege sticticalis TaxID=481309 RepID=A0ABR3HNL3_LOXSC